MFKKRINDEEWYIKPHISNSGGERGYILVDKKGNKRVTNYHWSGEVEFTFYYTYEAAEKDLNHLHGEGVVFGKYVTMNSFEILKMMVKNVWGDSLK